MWIVWTKTLIIHFVLHRAFIMKFERKSNSHHNGNDLVFPSPAWTTGLFFFRKTNLSIGQQHIKSMVRFSFGKKKFTFFQIYRTKTIVGGKRALDLLIFFLILAALYEQNLIISKNMTLVITNIKVEISPLSHDFSLPFLPFFFM